MKRLSFYLACAMILVACETETPDPNGGLIIDPETHGETISGMFAYDNGDGLSNEFIEFTEKELIVYTIDAVPTFVQGYYWHCSKSDFSVKEKSAYTYVDGQLEAGNIFSCKVVLTESGITLGRVEYVNVSGFKEDNYSSISIEVSELTITSEATKGDLAVRISNPISAGVLSAKSDVEWIGGLEVKDGVVKYSVTEADSERTGTITISYTNAADVTLTLKQTAPTCIILPKTEDTVPYEAGAYSFDCYVQNPIDGISLFASCMADWVSDITVQEGKISFNLTESASSNPRSCQFTISYGSYPSAEFTLTQQAMPVQSITLDKTSLDMTIGQQEILTATIVPEDAEYVWESSDVNVATVTADGQVTAVSGGTATITAKAGDKSASCSVNVLLAEDLSSEGTANCYIVNKAGSYKFKAVKGNSDKSVGAVASAEVLWESFGMNFHINVGDIIQSASYENDYVHFSTPSKLENGNAVIAVKDASGTILWSWHIWVCEGFDPVATEQVYNNNAGTMMDRNLGATKSEMGYAQTLGLLYQWGRKDPFLNSYSTYANSDAYSTITWPSCVVSDESIGTITYAIEHPTTYIVQNTLNNDWYYSGVYQHTDNTRWDSSKTIYDPCPVGWRVPDGGVDGIWVKALGTSTEYKPGNDWNNSKKGIDFGSSEKALGSGTIWYPAAGYRSLTKSVITSVGDAGFYWSCTSSTSTYNWHNAYNLYIDSGYVYQFTCRQRAYGFSVRCQKQ